MTKHLTPLNILLALLVATQIPVARYHHIKVSCYNAWEAKRVEKGNTFAYVHAEISHNLEACSG